MPSALNAVWTTMSTTEATVGTTNSAETLLPASIGSRHNLEIASREPFACNEHILGIPAFIATKRSSASSCRTSPTTNRDGRMRSASLINRRKGISPVPSRLACRVCSATQSGLVSCNSKTSSQVITRSLDGALFKSAFIKVVLPA